MLNSICHKISEVILDVVSRQTEIRDNAIANPTAYYNSIYRLQAGVLGIVFGDDLPKASLFAQVLNELTDVEEEALNQFKTWFTKQEFIRANLSHLYEMMLLMEFPIADGKLVADAENLDSIGSFYTPDELADKIVQFTLDNYVESNTGIPKFSSSNKTESQVQRVHGLFLGTSFADYSCGTGSFLLSILRYYKTHLTFSKQELKKIALNFYAIEADSLSLEIAKLQVLEAIGNMNLYSGLNESFVLGNPLIAPNSGYPDFDFGHEFYYHNGLAIEPNHIPKCDVIIGNPPWGEVGFDLGFFCHIVLPKVNEIQSQQELETVLGKLETSHPLLFDWLLEHEEATDLAVDSIYEDSRFQNSTNGGLHTNVLFTELCNSLCSERGTVGLVLKGSTLSDSVNKQLVKRLSDQNRICSRYDFLNSNRIFNIDSEETFSILILGNHDSSQRPVHKTNLTKLNEI